MDTSKIHAAGIQRHRAAWPNANQRAVDALSGTSIKPWDPGIKDAMPRVILRILDGLRLDAGEEWLAGNERWTSQKERITADEISRGNPGEDS